MKQESIACAVLAFFEWLFGEYARELEWIKEYAGADAIIRDRRHEKGVLIRLDWQMPDLGVVDVVLPNVDSYSIAENMRLRIMRDPRRKCPVRVFAGITCGSGWR